MIIHLKADGVVQIPAIDTSPRIEETKGGYMQAQNVTANEMIMLVPGYNEVEDDKWELAAPHAQRLVDRGRIEVLAKEDVDEDGNKFLKSYPISKIIPSKAKDVVKQCFNLKSLEKWLVGNDKYPPETRDEVRAMIKDQMDSIRAGNENTVGAER